MQKSVVHHGQNICKGGIMDNQQENLNDIVMSANKGSNVKKLILAGAVLLLVLILIILITKSLIQPEEKKSTQVILPPEPVSKPVMKNQEPLFEDIPIENEIKDSKIDEVINKIKEEKPKDDMQQQIMSEPKAKEIQQPKKERPRHKKKPTGSTYIQVGAFFNYPPDTKFIDSLKKEDLNYEILKSIKNGKTYKKVIVGPYSSRDEAMKVLPIIKKRINQNAYIFVKK